MGNRASKAAVNICLTVCIVRGAVESSASGSATSATVRGVGSPVPTPTIGRRESRAERRAEEDATGAGREGGGGVNTGAAAVRGVGVVGCREKEAGVADASAATT